MAGARQVRVARPSCDNALVQTGAARRMEIGQAGHADMHQIMEVDTVYVWGATAVTIAHTLNPRVARTLVP